MQPRDNDSNDRNPWAIGRRVAVFFGLVLVALGTLAWIWGSALTRSSPSWWRTVRTDDPRVIESARLLEEAVVRQLYEIRPHDGESDRYASKPWSVALSPADMNAWLNVRFPRWIEGRGGIDEWPGEVRQLQVAFEEDDVHLGALVTRDGEPRVVSATIQTRIDDQGRLWLEATRVRVGRLGVPARWLIDRVESGEYAGLADDESLRALMAILKGERPALDDPVHRLQDGRAVRLMGLRASDGRLGVTCRTEELRAWAPPS